MILWLGCDEECEAVTVKTRVDLTPGHTLRGRDHPLSRSTAIRSSGKSTGMQNPNLPRLLLVCMCDREVTRYSNLVSAFPPKMKKLCCGAGDNTGERLLKISDFIQPQYLLLESTYDQRKL